MLCLRLSGVPQLWSMINRALACPAAFPHYQLCSFVLLVGLLGLVSAHGDGSSESLTNRDADLFSFLK